MAISIRTSPLARDSAGRAYRNQGRLAGTGALGSRWFKRPVSRRRLVDFTRQLAVLLNAGLPVLRALEVIGRQARERSYRELLEDLAGRIRAGRNLSDGLAAHERLFGGLYVSMVRAGEAGGVVDVVLLRLAVFLEKQQRINRRLQTAMIYPAVITGVALAIVSALMIFVVPRFEDIFAGLLKGQPLPALTRVLINVSTFVSSHLPACLGLGASVAFGVRLAVRMPRGRRAVDWGWLRLPVVGELGLKAAVSRFTRTLGTLLNSGVPILQALAITRETSGNVHVARAITTVHERVKTGGAVAAALAAQAIFPPMVAGMVEVGEETGALPDMLNRIADAYDDEVDNAIAGLTTIIEPLMIVLMAIVVGTIVIALFLPLVGIIQQL
jgi:type IV pilus assembly protein PilC